MASHILHRYILKVVNLLIGIPSANSMVMHIYSEVIIAMNFMLLTFGMYLLPDTKISLVTVLLLDYVTIDSIP